MVEQVKLLLGASAVNYTDAQIELALKMALAEVEAYTNRDADAVLELMAIRIADIKLKTAGAEGLASQSMSGVSESYIDGYPQDILAVLNRKRKIKVV